MGLMGLSLGVAGEPKTTDIELLTQELEEPIHRGIGMLLLMEPP
jgi:hypothetical protein